jgi:DNA invertase Pin-like site-specific DNA recombinase
VVAKVYADNDIGVNMGKPRPAWRQLISDVQAGAIDAVIGWHVDRLTRSPRELEDVVGLGDKHGVQLATVTGEVDLSDPAGRLVARMLGAAARYEAVLNTQQHQQQRRLTGQARLIAGWGTRPFGYADDRITVVDTEAAIIRECAARVLAGDPLARICCDLAESGITTSGGKWWFPSTLRQLLVCARISGRREHIPRSNGQNTRPVVGEIVADAEWPAIISPDNSDQLRTLLADSSLRNNEPPDDRRELLRAILQCGPFCEVCQGGMIGHPRTGTSQSIYPTTSGRHTCGHTAMSNYYRDLWINIFKPKFRDLVGQGDHMFRAGRHGSCAAAGRWYRGGVRLCAQRRWIGWRR